MGLDTLVTDNPLQKRIGSTAFAFRGYNVTNLGKTPELLEHAAYGPIVRQHLTEASGIFGAVTGQKVDLVRRVRNRKNTNLRTYGQAIAMIVATELAQLKLLEEFHGVKYSDAQLAFGYSLGECSALVASNVFSIEEVLMPLLALAKDAAELARDVKMGVLFSRGTELDIGAIQRMCLQISSRGNGVISISSYLSPNTVLLLGQRQSVQQFKKAMSETFPKTVHLRINPKRWPPLHTLIARQRNISDRASVILDTVRGGFTKPEPPILSCVTHGGGYNDYNARDMMARWVDHPQHLWDVIDKTLAAGVETIIHVGPEPNIIPATLRRLSIDVSSQLNAKSLASLGLRAISRIVRRRRPWLTNLISSNATLLRAPFVEQIVLEDWLLEQTVE